MVEFVLVGVTKTLPRVLFAGTMRRVRLSLALSMRPQLLLMDVPFSALDAFTTVLLRHNLLTIWQKTGMTVIMVTHLVAEAVELADRVIVMSPRPGTIKEEIEIKLPRPRAQRSSNFYRYVDHIEDLVVQPQ